MMPTGLMLQLGLADQLLLWTDLLMQFVRDISHNISMINIFIICEPERLLMLRLVAHEAMFAAGNSEGRLRTTVASSAALQPTIDAKAT
jgi:hypothetical protein